MPRYAYVSLFGINSLDELKFAIFENVITLSNGVKKADLETLDAFINSKVGSWRKLTRIAQSLPIVKSVMGGDATSLVSFMTIRDQIVCIDDLERRGQKLDVSDVLGLISYLREQRNCKLALILNDEQLQDEARKSFERNLEKVVDVSLVYKPTPAESVKIGLPVSDETSKLVGEKCIALGIANIRVIKRIKRLVDEVEPLLKEFDDDVFKITVAALVLFSWSHDQPDEAPSIEYLLGKTEDKFGLGRETEVSGKEAAWNALLEAYGYLWTDDLDVELIESVRNGFYEPEKLKQRAKELHDRVIATKADDSFDKAWRAYHDSFANNEAEVLDTMYASFMKHYKYITPANLNGTVRLFKDLGRSDQAAEMLKFYVHNRLEDHAFFDLDESAFGSHIDDPDVRAAFKEKSAKVEEKRDFAAMLMQLKDGWSDEILQQLSTAPIEEYAKVFRSHEGADLRRILSGTFQFDNISNATDRMLEIANRARAALKVIGTESAINARRVRRFGVVIDGKAPAPGTVARAGDGH